MCDTSLAGGASAVVHGSMDVAKLWVCLCHCSCAIFSLHTPYNTARCGLCVIIWHLSDAGLSFIASDCHCSVTMFICVGCGAIVDTCS